MGVMGPFHLYCLVRNGFLSLSFEKTSILESYFIHKYIIIKYRSSSNSGIIYLHYESYDPVLVLCILSALKSFIFAPLLDYPLEFFFIYLTVMQGR